MNDPNARIEAVTVHMVTGAVARILPLINDSFLRSFELTDEVKKTLTPAEVENWLGPEQIKEVLLGLCVISDKNKINVSPKVDMRIFDSPQLLFQHLRDFGRVEAPETFSLGRTPNEKIPLGYLGFADDFRDMQDRLRGQQDLPTQTEKVCPEPMKERTGILTHLVPHFNFQLT